MSARTRTMPRRSCLSVPGSSDRFLEKAPAVPADMTFLDLEDSVAPLEKEGARAKVAKAIRELPVGRPRPVRPGERLGHGLDLWGRHRGRLQTGERLDEVMLPKVQTAAEVVALDLLLSQVEQNTGLPAGHVGIEAQIETTRGLINVEEISPPPPASRRSSSARRISPPRWRCRC